LSLATVDLNFGSYGLRVAICEHEEVVTAIVSIHLIVRYYGIELIARPFCVNSLTNFIKLINVHADRDVVYVG